MLEHLLKFSRTVAAVAILSSTSPAWSQSVCPPYLPPEKCKPGDVQHPQPAQPVYIPPPQPMPYQPPPAPYQPQQIPPSQQPVSPLYPYPSPYQQPPPQQPSFYTPPPPLASNKDNDALGWVLLGAGLVGIVLGANMKGASCNIENLECSDKISDGGIALIIGGGIVGAGGVYFLLD